MWPQFEAATMILPQFEAAIMILPHLGNLEDYNPDKMYPPKGQFSCVTLRNIKDPIRRLRNQQAQFSCLTLLLPITCIFLLLFCTKVLQL
jgi:hypothetical protein